MNIQNENYFLNKVHSSHILIFQTCSCNLVYEKEILLRTIGWISKSKWKITSNFFLNKLFSVHFFSCQIRKNVFLCKHQLSTKLIFEFFIKLWRGWWFGTHFPCLHLLAWYCIFFLLKSHLQGFLFITVKKSPTNPN